MPLRATRPASEFAVLAHASTAGWTHATHARHPCAASPATPPTGPEWLHEVKWDGMRVLADVADGRAAADLPQRGRRHRHVPRAGRAGRRRGRRLLDGEVVALVDGRPRSRPWPSGCTCATPAGRRRWPRPAGDLMVFDVLRLYGVDLLRRPLDGAPGQPGAARAGRGRPWQVPPVVRRRAGARWRPPASRAWRASSSKRRRSRYQPGRRSRDWVKTPHRTHQACVVGGWRPETGSTGRLGALLVGVPDGAGRLGLRGPGRQRASAAPSAAT